MDRHYLDIDAQPGTKVIYAYTDTGYPYDQKIAGKYLTVGGIYTIAYMDVHSSSTEVFLKEFPNVSFNSVIFTQVS